VARRPDVRRKINPQHELDFQPSSLKLTNEYYEKYEAASMILDENQRIVDLVHKDLKNALKAETVRARGGGTFRFTSDTVLRILVCQILEGLSLRAIVIRIDDSHYLRRFVRIYDGPMMDFTTLCKLKNCIRPKTWKKVNEFLARYAVQEALIEGDQLRLDTTAVETNIHWPTDSSLLWDTYRVIARLIEQAREIDPGAVGHRRLQTRKAKRLYTKISRKARPGSMETLRPLYDRLIQLTLNICQWADDVRQALEEGSRKERYDLIAEVIAMEIAHYRQLGLQVIDQASRRVLDGEQIPNDEKLFSIFEPHTELLKRGKTAKPIEFGHMIQIQQVAGKFITDYDVFDKKPVEHALLRPALDRHCELFGHSPQSLAADKGYYESMATIEELSKEIEVVSIAKKGRRSEEEARRESDPDFRLAQRFRAGVEGTISFLKRILGLVRCFNKGWDHYVSTIGAAIFTHNLLILTRT
jgi:IS5 family transposase